MSFTVQEARAAFFVSWLYLPASRGVLARKLKRDFARADETPAT
jgi:hypothetical protein